jgi:hypothetical protein
VQTHGLQDEFSGQRRSGAWRGVWPAGHLFEDTFIKHFVLVFFVLTCTRSTHCTVPFHMTNDKLEHCFRCLFVFVFSLAALPRSRHAHARMTSLSLQISRNTSNAALHVARDPAVVHTSFHVAKIASGFLCFF